jgi:hypothetical protein
MVRETLSDVLGDLSGNANLGRNAAMSMDAVVGGVKDDKDQDEGNDVSDEFFPFVDVYAIEAEKDDDEEDCFHPSRMHPFPAIGNEGENPRSATEHNRRDDKSRTLGIVLSIFIGMLHKPAPCTRKLLLNPRPNPPKR